jgi:Ca2+-binding RTX toxin-like protein
MRVAYDGDEPLTKPHSSLGRHKMSALPFTPFDFDGGYGNIYFDSDNQSYFLAAGAIREGYIESFYESSSALLNGIVYNSVELEPLEDGNLGGGFFGYAVSLVGTPSVETNGEGPAPSSANIVNIASTGAVISENNGVQIWGDDSVFANQGLVAAFGNGVSMTNGDDMYGNNSGIIVGGLAELFGDPGVPDAIEGPLGPFETGPAVYIDSEGGEFTNEFLGLVTTLGYTAVATGSGASTFINRGLVGSLQILNNEVSLESLDLIEGLGDLNDFGYGFPVLAFDGDNGFAGRKMPLALESAQEDLGMSPYASEDTVLNSGLMFGNVSLGEMDDVYDGRAEDEIALVLNPTLLGLLIGFGVNGTLDDLLNTIILESGIVLGVIDGGAGEDFMTGGYYTDYMNGGADNDLLYGLEGYDELSGGDGNDQIFGGEGDDELYGDAGNDKLDGGAGADYLSGGDGRDTARYADATSGVVVDLVHGGSGGDAAGDTYNSIERVGGSNFDDIISGDDLDNILMGNGGADTLYGLGGDDILRGGDGNDKLFGGDDDDTLEGGAGNDKLDGGAGADALIGGDGMDTARYADATSGVIVDLGFGGQAGDALGDTYDSIERVGGSNFADSIFGNEFDNVLLGQGGDDSLTGGLGNDVINGGDGADSIRGDQDDDILSGNAGDDTFSYIESDSGNDVITDFNADGDDTIFFSISSGVDSLSDLSFAQQGNDLEVSFGTSTILLLNTDFFTGIDAADFVFEAELI